VTSNELVSQEVTDGVAILAFNRPERNNAWSIPMEIEYFRLLSAAAENPDIRVIVVTGAGKSFCPGMDSQTLSEQSVGAAQTDPHKRTPMTLPRSIPKPVIAAINGACAGLGLVAAMQCDLRFASSAAKITTSFAHRGIMAEHGLAWSLPQVVGTSKALDLLFSARVVRGEEALSLGIVDRVFSPEALMDKTLEYARNLVQLSSPLAMGTIKRQVYAAQESTHDEARILAIRYWLDVLRDHGDFKEGVASFLEKRAPAFAPWDPSTTSDPAPLPTD
jgi:enoyl-CoA hydratase/carnithine racemase